MAKKEEDFLDFQNVRVMADMVADQDTPESLRIKIINKLVESKSDNNFFKAIFDQKLSYGKCPKCHISSHWLIPEVELNKFGYVTREHFPEIPEYPDEKSCPKWQQSCVKKKITV